MRATFWMAVGLGLGLALTFCGAARADDSKKPDSTSTKSSTDDADRAFTFSSGYGILGCRELIDARTTSSLSIRAQLGEENQSANFNSQLSAYYKDLTAVQAVGGASFLGMADAGAKISLQHIVQNFHFHGQTWRPATTENGVGDLLFAGKVTFKLGPWISLAPYAEVEVNSGAIRVNHSNQWKAGGAATAAFLNDRVAVHGNLTFVDLNGGKIGFGYRIGGSVVPLDLDFVLGRVVAYVDGLQYDGSSRARGSDVRLGGGVQAIFLKLVTFEVTAEWKVVSTDTPTHVTDVGTYGVGVAVGATLVF